MTTPCANCLRSPCECESTAWAVPSWTIHPDWRGRERWAKREDAVFFSKYQGYGGRLVRIRRKVKR